MFCSVCDQNVYYVPSSVQKKMERDKIKSVPDLYQIKFLIPVLYLQEIVSVIAFNMQALCSVTLLRILM